MEHPDEVAQGQTPVRDHPLDLVELGKVCRVQRLVPEHPVDREILLGTELLLLRQLVEHPSADRSRVGSQKILSRLFFFPVVPVTLAAETALAVDVLHLLQVLAREVLAVGRVADEEGVVGVPGRVLLRLEERVKVPETALRVVVCRHLSETHLEENLPIFSSDFKKGMQMA